MFFHRLDTWETEQDGWTETAKVLQHHRDCLESFHNANPLPDTPTKKRKLDHNSSPGTELLECFLEYCCVSSEISCLACGSYSSVNLHNSSQTSN